jgi:sec-independent protein translocase protein TatA
MFGFHPTDLIFVLIIALIIFGPKRLPEIGSAVGKGIREFKKATNEVTDHIAESVPPAPLPTVQPVVPTPQPVVIQQEPVIEATKTSVAE